MKCQNILFELLKTQPYFNKKALYQLSEQYGLKKTTVDTCISRSLKRKEIISLKNGLYISSHFNNQHKGDIRTYSCSPISFAFRRISVYGLHFSITTLLQNQYTSLHLLLPKLPGHIRQKLEILCTGRYKKIYFQISP